MKQNIFKISLLPLLVGVCVLSVLSSCKKDDDTPSPTLKSQLTGTWDITSFKVEDVEFMGFIVDSSHVQFKTYAGSEGDFQQMTLYSDGERENITGKYQVKETEKELRMVTDSDTVVVQISFPVEKNMEWTGEDEGQTVTVKAARR